MKSKADILLVVEAYLFSEYFYSSWIFVIINYQRLLGWEMYLNIKSPKKSFQQASINEMFLKGEDSRQYECILKFKFMQRVR